MKSGRNDGRTTSASSTSGHGYLKGRAQTADTHTHTFGRLRFRSLFAALGLAVAWRHSLTDLLLTVAKSISRCSCEKERQSLDRLPWRRPYGSSPRKLCKIEVAHESLLSRLLREAGVTAALNT